MAAFAYSLFVIAPTASFTLGNSALAAHCLIPQNIASGHIGMNGSAAASGHLHDDETVHHEARHEQRHDQIDTKLIEAKTVAVGDMPFPPQAPQETSDMQCCGIMCLTALPASLLDIVKPSCSASVCGTGIHLDFVTSPSPRHYRPPIS